MSDYTNNTPHELGWDDEIANDSGSYLLLEEGDYNFTVTGFERARFLGSEKIPPCNKAVLTLSVETDGGTASVKYDLILFSTIQWKIAGFCRAIGQAAPGDTSVRPRWNEMVGSRGRAHFKPRVYTKKDGSEGKANDVEKFYDYDPAALGTSFGSAERPSQQPSAAWSDAGNVSTPWDAGKF